MTSLHTRASALLRAMRSSELNFNSGKASQIVNHIIGAMVALRDANKKVRLAAEDVMNEGYGGMTDSLNSAESYKFEDVLYAMQKACDSAQKLLDPVLAQARKL